MRDKIKLKHIHVKQVFENQLSFLFFLRLMNVITK